MKVIATAGSGKLLVEMSELELARIMGYSSLYDSGYKETLEKARPVQYGERLNLIGLEVDVNAFARKVFELREKEQKARSAAETLKALASALESAWPELTISPKEAA